jgi:nucleotide-binding universal stress UspA family protein
MSPFVQTFVPNQFRAGGIDLGLGKHEESAMYGMNRPTFVVGVSGSAASAAALRWAADEAQRRGARLIAVRAWLPAQPAFYAVHADPHDADHECHAASAELAATLRAVFGAKPPSGLFTEVTEGMPERVLAERSAGADMLVLGSTSAPSPAGRSVGPVIRSCLSRAHCPVVIIRPESTVGPRTTRQNQVRTSDGQGPALVPI